MMIAGRDDGITLSMAYQGGSALSHWLIGCRFVNIKGFKIWEVLTQSAVKTILLTPHT